ncbi:MAG: YggS family pyridoxal phosphate-dependent enzyme [Symbiobacteriia bacterium]
MSNMVDNAVAVQQRIRAAALRAGRDPAGVTLIAVTKTVSAAVVSEAIRAGLTHLGENRVQEVRAKRPEVQGQAVWHLIGHLQTNKAKYAVELFDWIHSLDSLDLAEELGHRAANKGLRLPVLVQVNVAGEASKSGLAPAEVRPILRQVARLEGLAVRGLMTIAPLADKPAEVRPVFRGLAQLAAEIEQEGIEGVRMDQLSMGMSHDFEAAIEEGATMIRIGTALFGRRPMQAR